MEMLDFSLFVWAKLDSFSSSSNSGSALTVWPLADLLTLKEKKTFSDFSGFVSISLRLNVSSVPGVIFAFFLGWPLVLGAFTSFISSSAVTMFTVSSETTNQSFNLAAALSLIIFLHNEQICSSPAWNKSNKKLEICQNKVWFLSQITSEGNLNAEFVYFYPESHLLDTNKLKKSFNSLLYIIHGSILQHRRGKLK